MSTRFSFFLILFLFMLDICFLSFFQQRMFAGLLCLYIIMLFEQPQPISLSLILIFISFESLLEHANILNFFAYIAPITLAVLAIKQLLYPSRFQPYFVLAIALIAQSVYFSSFTPHLRGTFSYTILKIIANIIMMIILSLKLKLKAS